MSVYYVFEKKKIVFTSTRHVVERRGDKQITLRVVYEKRTQTYLKMSANVIAAGYLPVQKKKKCLKILLFLDAVLCAVIKRNKYTLNNATMLVL